ncbi:MAG: histidine kinase [Oscillospiraceae bacterium]|jgi:two-component system, OmpR family, sensor histidine kinase ArlS
MKARIFSRRGTGAKNIRVSFAFKTAAVYTLLFSLILAAVVAVLTSAYTAHAVRSQNLDKLISFIAARYERPNLPGPAGSAANRTSEFAFESESGLESFAEANQIYIEIKDMDAGTTLSYGDPNLNVAGHMSAARRINTPAHHMMIRVVSSEKLGFAGMSVGMFCVLMIALLLCSAAIGGFLIRKMLRPVYDMTRTVRSITTNDLSTRIDTVNSHDEFRELAETFNDMLDRIQDSYEKQNRFVSDASHELRTPLSVVSGYANLLRRWGSKDPDVLAESVDKIIEETDHMQQLVERLLFLTRADRKTQNVHFEEVNLTEMMREIVEETRMIDEEHTISEDIQDDVFLTADRALLKQAVRAIVDNSMKYTPAGGVISVCCQRLDDYAELKISDTGIGIAQKDLPHIFDRFYKADESRTRGKGSTGLGLSIAKWIVQRHNGTIRVESQPGFGTTFTVCLPMRQPPIEKKKEKAEP